MTVPSQLRDFNLSVLQLISSLRHSEVEGRLSHALLGNDSFPPSCGKASAINHGNRCYFEAARISCFEGALKIKPFLFRLGFKLYNTALMLLSITSLTYDSSPINVHFLLLPTNFHRRLFA